MWLYSSPLEALVVVVITGTDRTVISYININSLLILVFWHCNLVNLHHGLQYFYLRVSTATQQHSHNVRHVQTN